MQCQSRPGHCTLWKICVKMNHNTIDGRSSLDISEFAVWSVNDGAAGKKTKSTVFSGLLVSNKK